MKLDVFASGALIIECYFTDSNGVDMGTQFIIDKDDSFTLLDNYCCDDRGLTLRDWIINEIGGIISTENVANYLNGINIKYDIVLAEKLY